MRISTIRISAVAILASLAISQFAAADQEAETEAVKEHPLMPAIRYTEQCLERVEALPGYEATFIKREVVGNNTVSHRMKMKIRHEPFSVYLYFENPHAGREVIYVEGRNNGKLVVHEAGFLSLAGAMELLPTDSLVMSENRYPITKAGIATALRIMIDKWKEETQYGETEVKYFKDAKLGSMKCRVIESSHPHPRREFDNHKIRLWVDSATDMPVRMQKFGFPRQAGAEPPIIEDYQFLDLKTDVRLTDVDFDRNNKKYAF